MSLRGPDTPPAFEVRAILGHVAWKGLSAPFEKACRAAIVVLGARMLGPEAFGGFQYAGTAASLFGIATELGLGLLITRSIARDDASARGARGARIVATALRLRTLSGVVMLALVGAMAAVQGDAGETGARRLLLMMGVGTLVNAYVDLLGAVLRGHERFGDEAALNGFRALVTLAGGLLALRVVPSAFALAVGLAVGAAISLAFGLAQLARRGYLGGERHQGGARDDDLDLAAMFREALPLWLAALLSTIYFRIDIVIMKWLAGAAETGMYGASYRLFEALMIVPSVLTTAVFPRLVRAHAGGGDGRRLEQGVIVALGAVGVALGGALYVAGGRLLSLAFGPAFAGGIPSLRILALAIPPLSLNYALTYVLFARGRERAYLLVVAVIAVVNVTANLILIPRAGGRGAAWATLVTEALLAACLLVAVRVGRGGGRTLSQAGG